MNARPVSGGCSLLAVVRAFLLSKGVCYDEDLRRALKKLCHGCVFHRGAECAGLTSGSANGAGLEFGRMFNVPDLRLDRQHQLLHIHSAMSVGKQILR
jgi:hypothetical protein